MRDSDIPLSVVFGVQAPSPGADGVNKETARRALDMVRNAIAHAPAAGAVIRALDVGPGALADLARALGTPLSEIAVNAWNKRKEIAKYADPKAYPPDETHAVWLYEHELTETIMPTVRVRYAGMELIQLVFEGAAKLTFHSAVLIIRGGRITHVQLGDITAAVSLSVKGAELVDKELKQWRVPGAVKLGDGIRIGE